MKQVFNDNSIHKMKQLFVPFFVHFYCTFCALCLLLLFWIFFLWKILLSSQNKVFMADPNYIKEMQINWESFVVVRDKKFHVEIRVFFIWSFLTCLVDLVSKMLSSVSICYNNYKSEQWKRYLKHTVKAYFCYYHTLF